MTWTWLKIVIIKTITQNKTKNPTTLFILCYSWYSFRFWKTTHLKHVSLILLSVLVKLLCPHLPFCLHIWKCQQILWRSIHYIRNLSDSSNGRCFWILFPKRRPEGYFILKVLFPFGKKKCKLFAFAKKKNSWNIFPLIISPRSRISLLFIIVNAVDILKFMSIRLR